MDADSVEAPLRSRTTGPTEVGVEKLNDLAADYEMAEPASVVWHLSHRRGDLPDTFKEAAAELRRRLGALKLALAVVEDGRLILSFAIPKGTVGIRDSINSFRREWWIKNFTGEDGVTLDFELA